MGLFKKWDYDKDLLDISKYEPRKKGMRRLAEVFTRDYRDLFLLNIVFIAFIIPTIAFFVVALTGFAPVIMISLSLITAFPIGGAITACFFCITKILRDDPGFVMFDFKRKFRESFLKSAAFGIFCMVVVYSQVFLWGLLSYSVEEIGTIWLVLGLVIPPVFLIIAPYVFLQIAYIEIGMIRILSNSVFLALSNLPRSFMGALIGSALWIFYLYNLPVSLIFTPFAIPFGFSLAWLLNLMWVWPPFNKAFSVEESLLKQRTDED